MAEDFQAELCGDNWLINSSRGMLSAATISSPCSEWLNDFDSYGYWQPSSFMVDINERSCSTESNSVSDETLKAQNSDSALSLQTKDFNLSSSPTSYWNQTLHTTQGGERYRESSFNSLIQENMSNNNHQLQETNGTKYDFSQSTLLQSLYDPQPQQSLFNNSINNTNSIVNGLLSSSNLSKLPSYLNQYSSVQKQQSGRGLSAGLLDPPSHTQFLGSNIDDKPRCKNLATKPNATEDVNDSGQILKRNCGNNDQEPIFKRSRIETPSPLPTFKVRKEKLGDRVTALQQLVSPFGKTDTASVLHEAIDYIKFLHDQVTVLSTSYMNGSTSQHQQDFEDLNNNTEGKEKDLRSQGLCLVPISSTFPVANETTHLSFWTPTFGRMV